MGVKRIHIPSIGDVTLYKRHNSRSLRLSIGTNGEVRVSMPHWVPYKSGAVFAASKAAWIESMRGQHHNLIENGQAIGKAHHVRFYATTATRVTSRLHEQEIHIGLPRGVQAESAEAQRVARAACIKALRQEAEKLLPERLKTLALQGGYTFNSVSVKQLKSRWGSCSSTKDIALNIYLMLLPWQLIDYVLWHELAHTRVMRHGPPFWRELEQHMPLARSLSKEIHTYQPTLHPRST
ncbi:MAG TPA: SprT family zinc-dependent metalloprotease [Candidatus Saccharimonadales bacterium]|nr:SprT family zinc-dependent metalloprotease [Candidatus Saccharimonadales bacterium]